MCGNVQTAARHGYYDAEMLHEFVTANRQQIIDLCKGKVAKRFEPAETPGAENYGVPLFLEQLVETLKSEQDTHFRPDTDSAPAPAPTVAPAPEATSRRCLPPIWRACTCATASATDGAAR